MFRYCLATLAIAAALSFSGCCSFHAGCSDCGGVGTGGHPAYGPVESFRTWRKSLTCGNGCGEVYVDEWCSHPPDCQDPCDFGNCGTQLACGGCGQCGICRRPIRPLKTAFHLVQGIYGKRTCADCGGCDPCGCGGEIIESGCDCCSTTYAEGTIVSDYVDGQSSGCASGNCALNHSARGQSQPKTHVAKARSLAVSQARGSAPPQAATRHRTVQRRGVRPVHTRQAQSNGPAIR